MNEFAAVAHLFKGFAVFGLMQSSIAMAGRKLIPSVIRFHYFDTFSEAVMVDCKEATLFLWCSRTAASRD